MHRFSLICCTRRCTPLFDRYVTRDHMYFFCTDLIANATLACRKNFNMTDIARNNWIKQSQGYPMVGCEPSSDSWNRFRDPTHDQHEKVSVLLERVFAFIGLTSRSRHFSVHKKKGSIFKFLVFASRIAATTVSPILRPP